ncbi:hypothetical protein PE066_04260 [Ramlibacter tataouinensis]|uniref:hypothetical protein n=1 Tax=Ramlibacter tataouinensis TaxID=94132 RepID=UPI0022F3BFF7|nr:hypothetical protein [Ramlibacter tataouinensis]WBY02758.1 hypothetical protein PE066_04260 [Ramlibacter tataouinensis]
MNNKLDDLLPFDAYREMRLEVFPSRTSLEWFTRRNRDKLIEKGALFLIAGRKLVQPERYDEVVRAEGQRAAEARHPRAGSV